MIVIMGELWDYYHSPWDRGFESYRDYL